MTQPNISEFSESAPLVSIILPTYNWPSVLNYAIQTVLWQTFTDFELLVIGDACTDRTEELTLSFGDKRVRWHNLAQNTGNQAGPNNAGLEMARGRYIAYMHQDDLWLQNHLSILVKAIQSHDVYLAHSLGVEVGPPPVQLRRIVGLPNSGKIGPDRVGILTPAAIHRTDIARQSGGWRDWKTLYKPPTTDFWERLIGADQRFITIPEVTVMKFNSADRKNSYIEQPSAEQETYFKRIQAEPDFLYHELLQVLDAQARGRGPVKVMPSKPVEAKPGWEIDQYRQLRGLGATRLAAHRSLRPYLRLTRRFFVRWARWARLIPPRSPQQK